jgi:hypothetical protein
MGKFLNEPLWFRAKAATVSTYTLTCVADVAGSLHLKYFKLYDDAGSVGFWFDVDDAGGVAPLTGATRDVEIKTVTTGMTAIQVAAVVYAAVIADAKFKPGQDFLDGRIDVASEMYGPITAGIAGTSGFTVGTSQGYLIDDTTVEWDVDDMAGYSMQVKWTASAVTGTLKIQESNDGVIWTDLASAVATFANNNGNVIIHPATSYRFVKKVRGKLDISVGGLTTLEGTFHAKG